MSTIPALTSAPSAFPLVNIHPHGHKKGSQVDSSGNSGSTTAAQVPPATAQNLFGSLLQSLEQVIGVQLSATAPATASTAASTAGAGTADTDSAATASTNAANATSAGAASYLQTNGSQTSKAAGSNVSVNA
ncbi:MAG TPA: hypothetical protein VGN30_18400 [Steroidobacteraceae bacterium]|jgi:hypothetical protein